jgi:hypothetical protein
VPDRGNRLCHREFRVERIAGDVRDLGRQLGSTRSERHPAEGALIEKVDVRTVVVENESDAQVRVSDDRVCAGALVGRCRRRDRSGPDPELAAHAQVRDHGITVVQRPPQVLAPPAHRGDRMAGKDGPKVGRTAGMPAHGTIVEDLDVGHPAADQMGGQSAADDLDFG